MPTCARGRSAHVTWTMLNRQVPPHVTATSKAQTDRDCTNQAASNCCRPRGLHRGAATFAWLAHHFIAKQRPLIILGSASAASCLLTNTSELGTSAGSRVDLSRSLRLLHCSPCLTVPATSGANVRQCPPIQQGHAAGVGRLTSYRPGSYWGLRTEAQSMLRETRLVKGYTFPDARTRNARTYACSSKR